jgi:spermidine synthase
MSTLIFADDPESVLIVGLGGGTMAKFISKIYPDCKIKAIEKRENIKKIAYGYFNLPQKGNIEIIIGDCDGTLQELVMQSDQYDIILIDVFTGNDISNSLANQNIFDACKSLLTRRGVLGINLWSKSPNYKKTVRLMNNSFDGFTFHIPTNEKRNIIHLALPYEFETKTLKKMKNDAKELAMRINLPVDRFLKQIIKHNTLPGKYLYRL